MAKPTSFTLPGFAQRTKLATLLLLLALLLCCLSAAEARRRRESSTGRNPSDLNNPANPNSASYHSLYNGPGNGNGDAGNNGNAGGNGNGVANGLDGDPSNPRGWSGRARPSRGGGGSSSNGINYNGGPVMTRPITAYIIWYGNWGSHPALTVVPDFLANIGGSPWWNISTTYYDSSNTKVSSTVRMGATVVDSGSKGLSLTDADIQSLVWTAISSKALPADVDGVYFVLTSKEVAESSGFCTNYCGWHTAGSMSGVGWIKYSFVGNAERCFSACSAQTVGPNGDGGMDAMISIIAHELTEAASDPLINAWYDGSGKENADKCAWTFGTVSYASNGAKYNVVLPSTTAASTTRQYLLQQNWVNANRGYCAVKYP